MGLLLLADVNGTLFSKQFFFVYFFLSFSSFTKKKVFVPSQSYYIYYPESSTLEFNEEIWI
jgi:hypothetical protein